jgi:prephenate dehydrogenase
MIISRIAILGPGLLGGSVGLAAQASGYEVTLWGRNEERVEATRRLGLDATTDLVAAVSEADLVILAVPVGVMAVLAERFKAHLKPGSLVTDVGSVKALPHEMAEDQKLSFIGSHPMAGSEQTGIEAARGDLLEGAACILTNDQGRPVKEVEVLGRFWKDLGCQLTHAMAVVTASAALRSPEDEALAAGGFRDTTRVATGDPAMWAEIMVENRDALSLALEDAQNEIREMLDHLAKSDKKGLQEYLAEVKLRKEKPDPSS